MRQETQFILYKLDISNAPSCSFPQICKTEKLDLTKPYCRKGYVHSQKTSLNWLQFTSLRRFSLIWLKYWLNLHQLFKSKTTNIYTTHINWKKYELFKILVIERRSWICLSMPLLERFSWIFMVLRNFHIIEFILKYKISLLGYFISYFLQLVYLQNSFSQANLKIFLEKDI